MALRSDEWRPTHERLRIADTGAGAGRDRAAGGLKPAVKRHLITALAVAAAQAGALGGLFLAVSWPAIGYLFPWVIVFVVNLHLPINFPEMTIPILCLVQVVFVAVVASLAFGGHRIGRWSLVVFLSLHAIGILLCQPWTMSRTF